MAADAVDEAQLRDLIPGVLAALVHRGADFATAEDAVQEALVRAVETWPKPAPRRPQGLADHHGVAALRRSRPIRHRAAPPRGPGVRRAAARTDRLRG